MKYSVKGHLSVLLTTVFCLRVWILWLTVAAVVKNLTSQVTLMLLTTHCKYKQANKLIPWRNYQDCTSMLWNKVFLFFCILDC